MALEPGWLQRQVAKSVETMASLPWGVRARLTPAHLQPCGCLRNDAGAHRGQCPDYETIYPDGWSGRVEELRWEPRKESPR